MHHRVVTIINTFLHAISNPCMNGVHVKVVCVCMHIRTWRSLFVNWIWINIMKGAMHGRYHVERMMAATDCSVEIRTQTLPIGYRVGDVIHRYPSSLSNTLHGGGWIFKPAKYIIVIIIGAKIAPRIKMHRV